jgi:hypothetical protein
MHGPARIPCSLRQVPVGGSSSSSSSSSSSNSNDRIAGSASTAAGKVGVDGEVGVGACIGGLGSGCFELDVQGPARPGAPGQIAVIYRCAEYVHILSMQVTVSRAHAGAWCAWAAVSYLHLPTRIVADRRMRYEGVSHSLNASSES